VLVAIPGVVVPTPDVVVIGVTVVVGAAVPVVVPVVPALLPVLVVVPVAVPVVPPVVVVVAVPGVAAETARLVPAVATIWPRSSPCRKAVEVIS
jgi:hypothetical protein